MHPLVFFIIDFRKPTSSTESIISFLEAPGQLILALPAENLCMFQFFSIYCVFFFRQACLNFADKKPVSIGINGTTPSHGPERA